MYHVNILDSFDNLSKRFPDIEKHCDKNTIKILVGTKDDETERKVSR